MVEIICQRKEAQICKGNNHLYHKDIRFKNHNKIYFLHAQPLILRDLSLRVYKMETQVKYLSFREDLACNHNHRILIFNSSSILTISGTIAMMDQQVIVHR